MALVIGRPNMHDQLHTLRGNQEAMDDMKHRGQSADPNQARLAYIRSVLAPTSTEIIVPPDNIGLQTVTKSLTVFGNFGTGSTGSDRSQAFVWLPSYGGVFFHRYMSHGPGENISVFWDLYKPYQAAFNQLYSSSGNVAPAQPSSKYGATTSGTFSGESFLPVAPAYDCAITPKDITQTFVTGRVVAGRIFVRSDAMSANSNALTGNASAGALADMSVGWDFAPADLHQQSTTPKDGPVNVPIQEGIVAIVGPDFQRELGPLDRRDVVGLQRAGVAQNITSGTPIYALSSSGYSAANNLPGTMSNCVWVPVVDKQRLPLLLLDASTVAKVQLPIAPVQYPGFVSVMEFDVTAEVPTYLADNTNVGVNVSGTIDCNFIFLQDNSFNPAAPSYVTSIVEHASFTFVSAAPKQFMDVLPAANTDRNTSLVTWRAAVQMPPNSIYAGTCIRISASNLSLTYVPQNPFTPVPASTAWPVGSWARIVNIDAVAPALYEQGIRAGPMRIIRVDNIGQGQTVCINGAIQVQGVASASLIPYVSLQQRLAATDSSILHLLATFFNSNHPNMFRRIYKGGEYGEIVSSVLPDFDVANVMELAKMTGDQAVRYALEVFKSQYPEMSFKEISAAAVDSAERVMEELQTQGLQQLSDDVDERLRSIRNMATQEDVDDLRQHNRRLQSRITDIERAIENTQGRGRLLAVEPYESALGAGSMRSKRGRDQEDDDECGEAFGVLDVVSWGANAAKNYLAPAVRNYVQPALRAAIKEGIRSLFSELAPQLQEVLDDQIPVDTKVNDILDAFTARAKACNLIDARIEDEIQQDAQQEDEEDRGSADAVLRSVSYNGNPRFGKTTGTSRLVSGYDIAKLQKKIWRKAMSIVASGEIKGMKKPTPANPYTAEETRKAQQAKDVYVAGNAYITAHTFVVATPAESGTIARAAAIADAYRNQSTWRKSEVDARMQGLVQGGSKPVLDAISEVAGVLWNAVYKTLATKEVTKRFDYGKLGVLADHINALLGAPVRLVILNSKQNAPIVTCSLPEDASFDAFCSAFSLKRTQFSPIADKTTYEQAVSDYVSLLHHMRIDVAGLRNASDVNMTKGAALAILIGGVCMHATGGKGQRVGAVFSASREAKYVLDPTTVYGSKPTSDERALLWEDSVAGRRTSGTMMGPTVYTQPIYTAMQDKRKETSNKYDARVKKLEGEGARWKPKYEGVKAEPGP